MSDPVPDPDHLEPPETPDAATITVCPDGPLLVRGPVSIVDADGQPVQRSRATVALCRCGRSSVAPWCDGSHKVGRPGRGLAP